MMRPFVKVCGIRRADDARAAVDLGVDALGFILHEESPRGITPEAAAAIIRDLPPGVAAVGVTVDRSAGEVAAWVEACGFLAIQAHGDESPELCASYGVPVVKALATRPGFRAEDAAPYRGFPILLDGHARGRRGGTGRPADWRVARELVDGGVRLLLAGGLGPGRLREAVEAVRPLAVDLNSGVEREPGVKDPRRIAAALRALDGLERRAPEERPW